MSLTNEQKALRRTAIGSSDIGTIIGVSPYSPIEIWRQKVEGYERPDSPDLERGRFLEPAVADWYAHRTGSTLTEPGTLVCPSNRLVVATPDRIAVRNGFARTVELKTCATSDDAWGVPGSDEVPTHYLAQVQWELICTEHAVGDLAALKWGRTLDIYEIAADRELQATLMEMGMEWWDKYVKTATPPPVDGSREYAAYLKAKYPNAGKELLVAPLAASKRAQELAAVERSMRELESKAEEHRNFLKAVIGEAQGIQGDGWRATWKPRKDGIRVFKTKFEEAPQ